LKDLVMRLKAPIATSLTFGEIVFLNSAFSLMYVNI